MHTASDGSVHILLVHGSFARGAEWTREDAPLRRYLADALGDAAANTTIDAFEWSGRNSFRARTEATLKLQAAIRRRVAIDPNARLYLVAHSHGGNIALQAVTAPDIADHVDGIACLATPVIHSTLIAAANDDGRAIRLWTTMAALVPVALVADRLALDRGIAWTRPDLFASIALGLAGVVGLVVLARHLFPRLGGYRRIVDYNRRAALRLNALMKPPLLDRTRIVFMRHANDEATMTANFLGLVGWLSDRATLILEQRYRRLDALLGSQAGRRLTIGFAVLACALIALFQFVRAPDLRALVFGVLLLALAVPPLVSLVLRIVRAFGVFRALFFGIAFVPIGSYLRMSIEATPPGEWTVVMLPQPPDASTASAADIPVVDAHSRVYQQPEFLAFVSGWIAARVRGRPA